jgi:cation diffusion facilitator family transporter
MPAMAGGGSNPVRAILFAFFANLGIAIAKLVAALITGSSSMLAEAVHSSADTTNQLLLLLGLRQAKRDPDPEHPLGYGKSTYFWSFVVAVMLFTVGGMFSLYEGWHKLHDAEPPRQAWIAITVLVIAILLEGASTWGCLREIRKVQGERSLWQWAHESRNSELIVVLGEDTGAVIGLVLALLGVSLAVVTGDGQWDAYGSMAIGVVLLCVAVFVAIRVHALLIGRSAPPELVRAIEEQIEADEDIVSVYNVLTIQVGPDVMLAAKLRMRSGLTIGEACEHINELERGLKERFPEIAWSFIEPDTAD